LPPLTRLTTVQRQWADLREAAASRSNLLLPLPDLDYWYVFFDAQRPERANESLANIYGDDTTALLNPDQFWKRTDPGKDWLGFLMPNDELDRIGISDLERALTALTLSKDRFGWPAYLRELYEAARARPDVPPVVAGLWHYVPRYADLLNVAHREGVGLSGLLQPLADGETVRTRLPSEQCFHLLLQLCRKPYATYWNRERFRRDLGGAHPAVRTFFTVHQHTLERAFVHGRGKLARPVADAFYELCALDIPRVRVQELLDDDSGTLMAERLPPDLRRRYAPASEATAGLGKRLKTLVSKVGKGANNLFVISAAPASAPAYAAPALPFIAEGKPAFYELPEVEFDALVTAAPAGSPDERVIANRYERHLAGVLDALTAPILRWEKPHEHYRPVWRLPDPKTADRAYKKYGEEAVIAAREMAELEYQLPKLKGIRTRAALNRFQENLPYCHSPLVTRRLRDAIESKLREIDNQKTYRNQRMREFGIDRADESDFRKQLWLEEMLKIEEEVRPFIAYTRKAFQSALPVGTTVEFDPYRHSHDGVEFDPDTVQDQNKWLRGDVMKTLRGRKNFTPIVQVNTFCLDYSRSMTHDLMRDLFKVVFILIMGLEGRQSYDAIHFFGSDFFEVVGYDENRNYTNRSILFRVLRNISEIYVNRIVYSGVGGTNISAGVEKSHEKMKAFTGQLREDQPELDFVSSLFVLTDGQPTMGIIDLEKLHDFIEEKRKDGDVAIKGIFLKDPKDASTFITTIFGAEHAVDTSTFKETVRTFVEVMGRTYKAQRKKFRAAEKRRKLLGKQEV